MPVQGAVRESDKARLSLIYERLRTRLLDLTLKNPMLSYKHRASSKRHLRFVDAVPEEIYRLLCGESASVEVLPLRPPDDTPKDEQEPGFITELEYAKAADIEYLTALQALENTGHDDEIELAKLERKLRDRIRIKLDLPPRLDIDTISPVERAHSLGISPLFELPPVSVKDDHRKPRLQTLRWPESLDAVMEKIDYDARSAEQEMGFSTLFLAFGFLEWIDSKDSSKSYFAPLLLLPVTIDVPKRKAKTGKKKFNLSWTGDSTNTNLSLREMLKDDFNLTLPEFEYDDEAIGSVEKYFDEVRAATSEMVGWKVHRWLTLGHFNFGRFAMYDDLDPKKWAESPADHRLVGAVLGGTEPSDNDNSGLMPPDDYPIDDPDVEKIAPILIHDADASQHSALIDVMKSKNLVIQGPPGTGKSQTITNIIANALATSKTVLFLSEKQAALDVVKRRLDAAGLGEFCLELHSHKSTPKRVIESLKQRHALGYATATGAASVDGAALIQKRQDLNKYLAALSKPEEESVYDLIWRGLRAGVLLSDQFKAFNHVEIPDRLLDDPSILKALLGDISTYAGMWDGFANNFGSPVSSPWGALKFGSNAHQGIVSELLDDLEQVRSCVALLQALIAQMGDLGIDDIAALDSVIALHRLLPTTAPDGTAVDLLSAVSRQGIEALIQLQVEFNAASTQADSLPHLVNANELALKCLDELGTAAAAIGWDNLPPAEAITRGHAEIEEIIALRGILEGFMPAIEALEFAPSLQASAIESIYVATLAAVHASTRLHGQALAWFQWTSPGGLDAFEEANAKRTALIEDDAKWRATYPGRNQVDAWPSRKELHVVASLLRKGLLSRMVRGLSGDSKKIAALVEKLGEPAGAKLDPDKLEALAAHIDACVAFANSEKYQRFFGEWWRGFGTHFDEIGEGLHFQQQVKSALGSRPSGPEVFQRLMKVDSNKLRRIADAFATAEVFRNSSASLKRRLDDRSIEKLLQDAVVEEKLARTVIAADPDQVTKLMDRPIRILREAAAAERRCRRSELALRSHFLEKKYGSLVRSEKAIEDTLSAMSWIDAVRDARGIPESVVRGLLSIECSAIRARLADCAESAIEALDRLATLTDTIVSRYDVHGIEMRDLKEAASVVDNLLVHRDELGDFLALCSQKRTLEDAGLRPFIREFEKHALAPSQLTTFVDGITAIKRAAHLRAADPILRDANGSMLSETRKQFVKLDKGKLERDRAAVRNALIGKRPPLGVKGSSKKVWTEMNLLLDQFDRQRLVPVRNLMRRAATSVRTLKPCFMMSPLSLAKFLPARAINFDLVVIDEASQMLPEEALGALWRAKQLVVVGDQMQLPPTDFFARADEATLLVDDDDDIEGLDDGESILEICGNAFGRPRMLRWHYRSRCESLIAFSNAEFYHNELVTFPTARPGSFSVDLVKLAGNYRKGRNPVEAQHVAEAAIRFMRAHSKFDESNIPTLGIVAINLQQRDLIDEELRRLKTDDPDVEEYEQKVAAKGDEVFVKNLENVQGDERDFIFVSLTYGPEPGMQHVHQRFGPINGKNGHRRLNVLFTRARVRLALFTSMSSTDVRYEPGQSAEGVRILRSYLEYAERRGKAGGTLTGKGADSDFEIAVAERLCSRGYSVETQVGVSGYRIDLGIRHPDHPDRFIAGVECDGRAYHSSKSARDRDRLREEILRELGWTIIRVWSTDWFANATLQVDRLAREIEALRHRPVAPYEDYRVEAVSNEQAPVGPDGHAKEAQRQDNIADIAVHAGGEFVDDRTSLHTVAAGEDNGGLGQADVANLLRQFRDDVIAKEMNGSWEPHRSIARDAMIEAFIGQTINDPDKWFMIPGFLRAGTNPVEKNRYLEQMCGIVERLKI